MRAFYRVIQVLLVPVIFVHIGVCIWGVAGVIGITRDSSLPLLILGAAAGIGLWGINGATYKVLTGSAPAWARLLWLPGKLFAIVVTFAWCISILDPNEDFSFSLVWPPEVLARRSALGLTVAAAFTALMVESVTAVIRLEQRRDAVAKPAP